MATQVVMFVGALIICFGIVGVIYKIWTNQIADLRKARNREKIRQTELAVVKAQNEKYQQRLKDLETRINTIQALQNSRVGPVELMSALGNVVNKTNDVYLYTLAPAGDRLQLKGQSGTVDSMANFLAFLKNSGSFDDVQLEQFYQDDHQRAPDLQVLAELPVQIAHRGDFPHGGRRTSEARRPRPGGPADADLRGGPRKAATRRKLSRASSKDCRRG